MSREPSGRSKYLLFTIVTQQTLFLLDNSLVNIFHLPELDVIG